MKVQTEMLYSSSQAKHTSARLLVPDHTVMVFYNNSRQLCNNFATDTEAGTIFIFVL